MDWAVEDVGKARWVHCQHQEEAEAAASGCARPVPTACGASMLARPEAAGFSVVASVGNCTW